MQRRLYGEKLTQGDIYVNINQNGGIDDYFQGEEDERQFYWCGYVTITVQKGDKQAVTRIQPVWPFIIDYVEECKIFDLFEKRAETKATVFPPK
jgi:hypothetical protein